MAPEQLCPNCPDGAARQVFTLPPSVRVLACRTCGLQFAAHYPEYTVADAGIYSFEYFEAPIENNAHRERVFGEMLAEIESVHPSRGRLLDIGAGEGTLLSTAAARGWQVVGTEISSAMLEHVRARKNLEIHHGVIEEIDLPEHSFDVVVLNHVLEHVRNPHATLRRIASLLSPSGVVRLEVPNLAGLSSRMKGLQSQLHLKKNPWKHYSTDHHFWFFTPETLARTLDTAGFRVHSMRAPAKQWGRKTLADHLLNGIYQHTLWGRHIVAYAHSRG